MKADVELGEFKASDESIVDFNSQNEASDTACVTILIPEFGAKSRYGGKQKTFRKSLKKSARSVHHLRDLPVEELAADVIEDAADAADLDARDKSAAYRQFRYLESKSEIRCLTRPMQDRRKIMELLEEYGNKQPTLNSNSMSLVRRAKWHRFLRRPTRSWGRRRNSSARLEAVEGKLGTGGSLFFRFVRSVVPLNLLVFLLSFFFLSLPQMARRWSVRVADDQTESSRRNASREGGVSFTGREIILGDGWFEGTEMYYGSYRDDSWSVYSLVYDMRVAYFIVVCFILASVLLVLCFMFSRSLKNSYIISRRAFGQNNANMLFCAWNFNVRESKMAALCSSNIFLGLEMLASELSRKKQKFGLREKVKMVMMTIVVEVFIVSTLVASPVALYHACQSARNNPSSLAFRLGIPALLTFLNRVVPSVFSALRQWEKFTPSTTVLYFAVVRTSTLQVCNLAVMVYYWLSHLACSAGDEDCAAVQCWETFVGTQLYALVALDFLFTLLIFALQLLKRCLHKVVGSKVGSKFVLSLLRAREFDVGRASVDVIYVQCLMWLSIYFSPLLSIIISVELLITYHLKKLTSLVGCYEPVKAWRLGHLETFIRIIHLVTFLLCLSVFIYVVAYVKPSGSCGPFRRYGRPYEIFESSPSSGEGDSVGDSFGVVARDVLSSVGFRIYVCFLCGIAVYYMRALSQGRCSATDQLKRQIELESHDRCFYLDRLQWMKMCTEQENRAEPVDCRRQRPGIFPLVRSMYQASPLAGQSIPTDGASPVTPCTGPAYWPQESRHLVTSEVYNVMFPNKRASNDVSTGTPCGGGAQDPEEVVRLPVDEVDRLFDFDDYAATMSPKMLG